MDGAMKRPVIWVAGPAGCGKTVFVASYLREKGLPSIWYQVDEGDTDVATFFYYMGLAAKKSAPRKKALPLLTPEYLKGILTFSKRYFEGLYARLHRPYILVFDNYQDVAQESIFHQVVQEALSTVPEGIHVVVISRSEPPSSVARLFVEDRLQVIGWEDLRFTAQESRSLVQFHSRTGLSKETISKFYHDSQGWAAGLILMAKHVERGRIESRQSEDVKEKIFSYFAGEIFDKLDVRTRDLLLKTAFPRKITVSMACRLTKNRLAGRILTELSRKNFFTEKRLHGEPVYQYHALFREFLIDCAKRRFSVGEVLRLQIDAATLLQEAKEIEDAAELYMASNEWEPLVRLITGEARSLWAEGRTRTLEDWLRRIPRPILEQTPWLSYWLGCCKVPYAPLEARGHFERAFAAFKATEDLGGVYDAWCGIVDTFVYEWGNFSPLDPWILEFERIFAAHPVFPTRETEIRVTASMLYGLLHRQPDRRKISFWEQKARGLLRFSRDDANLRMMLMNPLLLLYLWIGEPTKVSALLDDLKEEVTITSNPLLTIFSKTFDALHCLIAGRPDKGLQAVAEGLRIGETTGILHFNSFLYNQGANCGLALGDRDTVMYYMEKLGSELSRPLDVCHYHLIASLEALSRDDLSTALHHADLTTKRSIECGAPWPVAINRVILAEALFKSGDRHGALGHLGHVRRISQKMGSHFLEYNWLVARSYFAFRDGNELDGIKYLSKFMKLGREKRYVNTDLGRHNLMAFLCTKALEAGIEVEYVQDLITTRRLLPDPSGTPVENWPYPLKVHTLGRFRIIKGGKPLSFTGKIQQKPLLMLKALIAFGGDGVSVNQLADVLWPDADGDLAHQSFDTTLHRLRRLTGDQALQTSEGQITLDKRYCWVDLWRFENILGRVEAAIDNGPEKDVEDGSLRLAEKAIDLYKGHFLPAETLQPWTLSTRERLRNQFLRLVIKLGKYFEEAGRLEKAVDYFEKGLEVDDLAEEFYQRLMSCYQRLGQETRAIAIYSRCRILLSSVLGIPPSSKTEEIFQTIVKTKPHRLRT
jgi:LuxR family transcriptional regulator, maltose regulon positive regulatory protein